MFSVATPLALLILGVAVPDLKNSPPCPMYMFTNSSAKFQPAL